MNRVIQIKLQPTKPIAPAAVEPRGHFRIAYRRTCENGVSDLLLPWIEAVVTVRDLNACCPDTTHWLIPASRDAVTIGSILKPTHEWN